MFNRVILIGRLTKDPNMRYTPAGVAVTQFTLACDRPVAKGKEKEVDFINIVTWRELAESCANYLKKGRLIALEGRMQTRNYDNNEGRKIYITEVIADNVKFLEKADQEQHSSKPPITNNPLADDWKPIDISDSDLPF